VSGDRSRASRWAGLAGLTTATTFSIVEELAAQGLVRERGIGASAGGRRPLLFGFNPAAYAAIGVHLRSSRLVAVMTDLDARPLAKVAHPYRGPLDGMQAAALVGEVGRQVMDRSGIPLERVVGVGICVPALIDVEGQMIVKAINLGWENVPLRALVEQQLSMPVYLMDVSVAMAVAETYFGAGRGVENLICINVGTGVGSGIVIGGRLYRGVDGAAGEIGHTTVDDDGPQCRCGNYGCLERLVASPAIVERAIKGLKQGAITSVRELVTGKLEGVTVQVVAEAARSGDEFARGILAETGRYLGVGIANVVNLLNPEMVIVGGSVAELAGDLILEPMRQAVKVRAFEVHSRRVRIAPAAIGAATWAMIQAGFLAAQPLSPVVG
jgi:N-acetylglucosamine repressor